MTRTRFVSLLLGSLALVGIVALLFVSEPRRSGSAAQASTSHAVTPNRPASEPPNTSAYSAEPSQSAAPASPEAPPPSPNVACCSPAPTLPPYLPTPVPGESLAESDAFWDHWAVFPHFGELPLQATSLAENVELAHLVIRGHIIDVYVGEVIEGDDPDLPPNTEVAYVTVAIGEVLKGAPVSRTPGYVEVQLGYSPPQLDSIQASLPQHDALWFLMHDVTIRPRPPEHDSEIAPFTYFGSNDLQGVMRNVDGEVRVIKPEWIEEVFDASFFPLPLEGTSFDEVVEQVRGIAEEAPAQQAITIVLSGSGTEGESRAVKTTRPG